MARELLPVEDQLLSVRQVAEICKVKPKTVRRWISAGQLDATRVNERANFRIWRSELMRRFSATPTAQTKDTDR